MIETKIYSQIKQGYNKAAADFSRTRQFNWKDLEFIKQYISKNDKLLDFGCGNGRLIDLLKPKPANYLGVDISHKLIQLARKKYPGFRFQTVDFNNPKFLERTSAVLFPSKKSTSKKLNSLNAPLLAKNQFNSILAIAVFHHLPQGPRRDQIIKVLHSLLVPGGKIILTVWNLNQPQFNQYFPKNKKDGFIPFKNQAGKVLFNRYHYRWEPAELNQFLTTNDFKIIKSGATRRAKKPVNLFAVAQKVAPTKQNP